MAISLNYNVSGSLYTKNQYSQLPAEPIARGNNVNNVEKVEKAAEQRLDIDEKALNAVAQVAQEREQKQAQQQKFELTTKQANVEADFVKQDYDEPSKQNRTAITAYQAIDNLADREQVKQLFGVDLVV